MVDICEAGQLSPEEEKQHWWIRTRFFYLDKCFKKFNICSNHDKRANILEIGCGTAQNIRFLREESPNTDNIARLVGVDPAITDSDVIPAWITQNDCIVSSLDRIPSNTHPGTFDLLIAMDVLEHIQDDASALQSWLKHIKTGGGIFITVPAFQSLWSHHDEILNHKRRYTRISLARLGEVSGLTTVKINYGFGAVFPAAWIIRKLLHKNKNSVSTDLQKTNPIINSTLTALGKIEAVFGGNPFFGTSVIGYFRKK